MKRQFYAGPVFTGLSAVMCACAPAQTLPLETSQDADGPPDIVGKAARAISDGDAKMLEGMQFSATGFDRKPISISKLLGRIEGCKKVADYPRGSRSIAHQLHFDCPNEPAPTMRCASPIIVVYIDRASSPHVTAYLQYDPLDTPECRRPAPPG